MKMLLNKKYAFSAPNIALHLLLTSSFVQGFIIPTRPLSNNILSNYQRNRFIANNDRRKQDDINSIVQKRRKEKYTITYISSKDTKIRSHNVNGDTSDFSTMKPKVYPQRWIQLAYLSALALLSDWLCFAVAAAPSTFESSYSGHSAANLIDLFLFTNVASCFIVTDTVRKIGLGKTIKGAAVLMTLGCFLRSGVSFFDPLFSSFGTTATATADILSTTTTEAPLVPYWSLALGTILVGIAQPFFQCTPPLLSAKWFAPDERATATAVSLNFNQIGIATAFLVGGGMATDPMGLAKYFGFISLVCSAVTIGTLIQFQNAPPTPPSSSEIEKIKKGEEEPPFIESVKKLISTPGFGRPLAAFIMSLSITNIVGAFIDEVMQRGGVTEQFGIDIAGAGFEFSILLGGIIIGGYVDKTKEYKTVTLACSVATMLFLIPLGFTDHAIGQEPLLLILALLGLGMTAGPVQPINAELAVDITYPSDETAVESVQQIGGNLVSALLVPVAEMATAKDFNLFPSSKIFASDIRGDVILLLFLSVITYVYYSGFDSPLRRTLADANENNSVVEAIDIDIDIDLPVNGKASSTRSLLKK